MKKNYIALVMVALVLVFTLSLNAAALPFSDRDGDLVPDSTDTCPNAYDITNADNERDGSGDVCDTDDDNDGQLDTADPCPFLNANRPDGDRDCLDDAQGDPNVALTRVTASARPTTVEVGEQVQFTCTATGGDQPLSFSWNFGDGTPTSAQQNPTHVYTEPGTQTATCNVRDSTARDGSASDSGRATTTVTVTQNNPPIITIAFILGSVSPTEGDTITFTATASDPDRDRVSLSGNADTILQRSTVTQSGTSTNPRQTVTWVVPFDAADRGPRYNVTFLATDDRGALSKTEQEDVIITVKPNPRACEDNVDNDGDGLTDFDGNGNPALIDPACLGTNGQFNNDESLATSQCQDTLDNDADSLADSNDPGCWTNANDPNTYDRTRNNEAAAQPQCSDTLDNDVDSLADSNDPGCWTNANDPNTYDRTRNNENSATSQCQDTLDNDADSLADRNDPGCWTNANDPNTYDRTRNSEAAAQPQCSDGLNNDPALDDDVDFPLDFGCSSSIDNSEINDGTPAPFQCNDGIDNNGNGLTDQDDPGCSAWDDNGENNPPVVSAPQTVDGEEGQPLTFTATATDADNDPVTFSARGLPRGAQFNAATGTFTWTPDFTQAGTYTVTVEGNDGNGGSSTVTIQVTIREGNQPPVFTSPVPPTAPGNEGTPITFRVVATDPTGELVTVTHGQLPPGARYDVDPGNPGSGTFTWTPGFDFVRHNSANPIQNEVFVSFTATDNHTPPSGIQTNVRIVVNDVNREATITSAVVTTPAADRKEGQPITIHVVYNDLDDEDAVAITPDIPGAVVAQTANHEVDVTWTPDFNFVNHVTNGNSRQVTTTLTANDGFGSSPDDTEQIGYTVADTNRVPTADFTNLPVQPLSNQDVVFTSTSTDADAEDVPNLLYTWDFGDGTPVYTARGNGGALPPAHRYAHGGTYNVQLTITDERSAPVSVVHQVLVRGALSIQSVVCAPIVVSTLEQHCTVTVHDDAGRSVAGANVELFFANNNAPVSTPNSCTTGVGGSCTLDYVVNGPGSYTIYATATHPNNGPDADKDPQFTYEVVPQRFRIENLAVYNDPGFTVADTDFLRSETVYVSFQVNDTVLGRIVDVSEVTGQVSIVAPPGGRIDLTQVPGPAVPQTFYFQGQIPNGDEFLGNGLGLALVFRAPDGAGQDEFTLTIGNNAPQIVESPITGDLGSINTTNFNDGRRSAVLLTPFEHDVEDASVDLTWSVADVDTAGTISVVGKELVIDFIAAGLVANTHDDVRVILTDSEGDSVEQSIRILVDHVNRAPELVQPIVVPAFRENTEDTFTVTATDLEAGDLTFSTTVLPTGMIFTQDSAARTATFRWTPDFTQSGSYTFTVTVADSAGQTDSEEVTVAVTGTSRDPVLDAIGDKAVSEDTLLTFAVSATDPDNDPIVLSTSALPDGATFDPATGNFAWTPQFNQAGSYTVTFTATDSNGGTDSETVTITVGNINRAPEVVPFTNAQIEENTLFTIRVVANDVDGDRLTLTAQNVPTGASFVDNGDSTGTFTWTPDFTQAGSYTVTFTATDGLLSDAEAIAITVGNHNRAPVLDPIGNKEVTEESTLIFTATATDADGDRLRFSVAGLPNGAQFDNTTGVFTWTPVLDQAGDYVLTFSVSDTSEEDREAIAIKVKPLLGVKIIATPLQGDAVLEVAYKIAERLLPGETVVTARWNFGDGGVSTIPRTHHTYSDEGSFVVTLTTTTNFGNIYTDTETILVGSEPADNNPFKQLRIRALRLLDGEVYHPGDNLGMMFDLHNEQSTLEDLMATVTVQDLDLRRTSRRFDLKAGQTVRDVLELELPYDTPQGWYDVRFSLTNEQGFRRVVYREFYVE